MTDLEIAVEAGRAARRGETHPIPEIAKVSAAFRQTLDDWGKRANEQGLLSKEAIEGIDNYFPRLYDLDYIHRHWGKWERVVARHFAKKYPDLEAGELEDIAEDIFDTLSNTRIGQPFPKKFTPKKFQPKPGHLKGRTWDIEDIELEDFLIDDIRIVAKRYGKNVTPHIILREIFGQDNLIDVDGIPMPKNVMEMVQEDYRLLRGHAKDAGDTQKFKKLKDEKDKRIADAVFIYAELLNMNTPTANGMRGLATDFARSPQLRKITGGIKGWTAASALGQMVLMAFADLGNPVLYNGLLRMIKVAPVVTMPKKFSPAAKRYIRTMNVGLDRMDAARMSAVADLEEWGLNPLIWDDPAATMAQKARHAVSGQNVARVAFKYMPANVWNASMKTIDGFANQDRILTDVMRWGKLNKTELAMYNRLGIDESWAKKIAENFGRQKVKTEQGSRFADLDNWDNDVSGKFTRIVYRESEMQVVTPQVWERPISLNNEIGGFVNQFKGFMQSHVVQHLANAGQRLGRGDIKVLEFIMTAWTMAVMADSIKVLIRHNFDTELAMQELSDRTLADWVFIGIDKGALSGFGTDVFLGMDNFSNNQLGPSIGMSEKKFYSPPGLGVEYRVPGLGYMSKAIGSVSALGKGVLGIKPFTAKDLHNIRGLIPLQNLFYLAWLFNISEKELAEALDLPETGGKKSRPKYGT